MFPPLLVAAPGTRSLTAPQKRLLRVCCGLFLFCYGLRAFAAGELQALRFPWDDSSPAFANLQPWQSEEAGSKGWVRVSAEGHYEVAGQRIRFIGVNAGAVDAFPTQTQAQGHAGRLAKFGFNVVRFHHLEAPWEKTRVLVDYTGNTSRKLSAERFDRLHYFVAALAAKGVYSNINLLVSREFQTGDGLGAEIAQLGWKDQQILGHFYEPALELHKEYATQVLSAPNPYRGGRSLAQDPAVAFVEILNENGLVQKWFEGVLDTLPERYAEGLRSKWNSWLKDRYSNTAAMLQAWGSLDQAYGTNLLNNPSFATGATGWNLEQHAGATASLSATTDFNGQPAGRLSITKLGTESWHVQLNQSPLELRKGTLYTLSFWAKANSTRTLSVSLSRAHTDYASLGGNLTVTLDTTWREYSVTFEAAVEESRSRVNFSGLGATTGSVWLADVRFRTGGKLGGIPTGTSLEAGTVPSLRHFLPAPAPTRAQRLDWVRYLLARDKAYWTAMQDHVKKTLAYPGLVWGTIISNSPPNAQDVFDSVDTHAYWQHAAFEPGYDWDPERWTVGNISMVNSPTGNTLTGIARQRVKGKPLNVTEYQHTSPNTYSSEGPLLAAIYGALQDWDSIYHFAYQTGTAEYVTGFFDHGGHPGKMANNLIAAALFRRGDLRTARREYPIAFSPETEAATASTKGGAWSVSDGGVLGVPASLTMESRLSLVLGDKTEAGLATLPTDSHDGLSVSDTGQVSWDTRLADKGVVTVDTPLTKAVVGFAAGRSFQLGGVEIVPGVTRQDWCTLALTLLEGSGFSHPGGGRALLVATGDQENTGQVWKNASRTSVGSKWGGAPTLVEVVPARLTLPLPARRVKVWTLDGRGQRAVAVPVTETAGKAVVELGKSGVTLWYELELAPEGVLAPVVTAQPLGAVYAEGASARLVAAAEGWPTPTVQWYLQGLALPGATQSTLDLGAFSAAKAGRYQAVFTNSAGTSNSREVQVTLAGSPAVAQTQLLNVSTQGEVKEGFGIMVAGFAVSGERELLLRGVGPELGKTFQLPGALSDPRLDLYRIDDTGSQKIGENEDWNPGAIGDLFERLYLFPLSDPRESCLRTSFPSGLYTAELQGRSGVKGRGILELYSTGQGTGKIISLSTRAFIGPDGLTVGFHIQGSAPKRVLIRGLGPALGAFAVEGTAKDTYLELFQSTEQGSLLLATNDDWEDQEASAIVKACTDTYAFPMTRTARDAALLVWLEPGTYTAVVREKGGTGIGLVEIYEAP